MKFTKMQGAGNDFVVINNIEERIPEEKLSAAAKRLCARRLSVGADGLMVVTAAKGGGDFGMLFFNADGSLGEMCGNGARCIARYGYERGLAGETQRVETTSGLVVGERVTKREYRVRLNDPTVIKPDMRVSCGGRDYDCGYFELGSPGLPHAVFILDGFDGMPEDALRALGRELRYAPAFPKGANVTFCRLVGPDEVKAVTFERGVEDFTLACGTGSGCTTLYLTLKGYVGGRDVLLHFPGGDLRISLDVSGGTARDIYLTGPTNIVAEGEITDEELAI